MFTPEWFLLIGIMAAGLASPGPDFVMIIQNSLGFGRAIGVATAIGLALGVLIHVGLSIAGVAVILTQSIILFTVIKVLGAGYLIYIGYKALQSQGFEAEDQFDAKRKQKTIIDGFIDGLVTNVMNPKAILFFFAVISQIISPDLGWDKKVFYLSTCSVMTFGWFSILAVVMTTPAIRNGFIRISKWVDRVCGALFVGLGIKLVLSKAPNV